MRIKTVTATPPVKAARKRLTVTIDAELLKKLKLKAVDEEVTMGDIVEFLLKKGLDTVVRASE